MTALYYTIKYTESDTFPYFTAEEEWRDQDGNKVNFTDKEEKGMTFSGALKDLKKGIPVYRKGWNGKNMWLMTQKPDSHSKMSLPYIYMCTADGDLVPWVASHTDLLSEDWFVLIHD